MPIQRRDFMKVLGISVASLFLSRCRSPFTPTPTCYAPVPPSATLPGAATTSSARERLRLYWLRFDEFAQRTREDTENDLRQELTAGHRDALTELVTDGELSMPVANLVQEAYEAAVTHIWHSNASVSCYKMTVPNYGPSGAAVLVEQSKVLNQVAETGTVDPATLEKARAALEQDLSFYALTDEELQDLYDELRNQGQPFPEFEKLPLEASPEVQEATQFIIDLLTGK